MDIKIVDAENNEVKADPPKTPEQIDAPALPQLLEEAVAQVMGIEDSGDKSRYADKIQTLLQYAMTQTKDHTPENIKWAIRSLELKLGTPPLAEKKINYVARYAYLAMESSKIKNEMKSFENPL